MSRSWTPKPHFCGGRAYLKGFSRASFGMFCLLALASCGESTPSGYHGSAESAAQSDTLQPLTIPPNATDGPPAPGTTGAPKTADGLPALQVKGVNTKLFSQKLSDESDRLDRLENAVQELRNDFDSMAPAIVRLVSIEGDIQGLIKQLEVLNGDPNAVSAEDIPTMEESDLNQTIPAQSAPAPLAPLVIAPDDTEPTPLSPERIPAPSAPIAQEQTVAPVTASPAPVTQAPVPASPPTSAPMPLPVQQQASSGPAAVQGTVVTGVRVGEHPGKIRLVLDLKGKTSYTADLDNNEKILVIELPDAGWSAESQKTYPASSPLLASYKTEKLGDHGTMLILQLKAVSSIAYKAAINDANGQTGKIVIDLSTTP